MSMLVWSYGGGVQSAAIGALIARGDLPKPDLAVIADTGREPRSTWDYLRDVMNPLLVGSVTIQTASHDLATVDLFANGSEPLIPAFTSTGKLPTFCSNEWKARVVRRWLRARSVEQCDMWLGISVDEIERAKDGPTAWCRHVYPLLTIVPMRRSDCSALLVREGIPVPPRSSCWMCPHRQNDQWRALPADEFAKAVELEREMNARDPRGGGLFLHSSRVPLDQADLNPTAAQGSLDLCDGGHCWT